MATTRAGSPTVGKGAAAPRMAVIEGDRSLKLCTASCTHVGAGSPDTGGATPHEVRRTRTEPVARVLKAVMRRLSQAATHNGAPTAPVGPLPCGGGGETGAVASHPDPLLLQFAAASSQ